MSRKYWHKRALDEEKVIYSDSLKEVDREQQMILDARVEVEKKIRKYLEQFKDINAIESIQKAREIISGDELEEFKWDINKYGKEARYYSSLKDKNNTEARLLDTKLKNSSLKYRIGREEAMLTSLDMELARHSERRTKALDKHLSTVLNTTIGLENETLSTDKNIFSPKYSVLEASIKEKWAGNKNFSQRIWGDNTKISEYLKENLPKSILRGDGGKQLIKEIRDKFNISIKNAKRLVLTESARVYTKGKILSFSHFNVKKVQLTATLDSRTSEICQEKDKTIVSLENAVIGVDLPPFHPYCRTTFYPYFETLDKISEEAIESGEIKAPTRIAKNPITNEVNYTRSNTYRDWKKEVFKDNSPIISGALNDYHNVLNKKNNKPIILKESILKNNIVNIIEKEFGKLNSNKVVLFEERLQHIRDRHPEIELDLLYNFKEIISNPTFILKDSKNKDTIWIIKNIDDKNMNIIIKLSVDDNNYHSVITAYKMNYKQLQRYIIKNKKLFDNK